MRMSGFPCTSLMLSAFVFLTATTTTSNLFFGSSWRMTDKDRPWAGFVQFLNCFGFLVVRDRASSVSAFTRSFCDVSFFSTMRAKGLAVEVVAGFSLVSVTVLGDGSGLLSFD